MHRVMWVIEIELDGKNAVIGSIIKKFKVSFSAYPISVNKRKDGIYVYFIGFISGDKEKIEKFKKSLKKTKSILNLEGKDGFVIGQIKEPFKFWVFYQHKIVHLKPIIFKEDGTEIWYIGSWEKNELNKIIEVCEKTYDWKLSKIREEEITNFSIVSSEPRLTSKQKNAIELAMKRGYYNYPRKTELKKLAKIIGLSYSTYQAHLRKAEIKLLNYFLERSG